MRAARKKRTWLEFDGKIYCYRSPDDLCRVTSFRSAKKSGFHDEAMIQATKEINAIFKRLQKQNSDTTREPALIDTGEGLLLAWVHCNGAAGAGSGDVAKTLGLKKFSD